MPYVTSAERIGIEKGKLEGRSEGLDIGQLNEAREMVLEALDTKFSSNVPADIRPRRGNSHRDPALTFPLTKGHVFIHIALLKAIKKSVEVSEIQLMIH